jgi:DNA-3-methyladenine glycosylase
LPVADLPARLRTYRSSSSQRVRRLRRAELPLATIALARFLVGKVVVRELHGERLSGRIVETEAYPPGDAASHAFRGRTPRNGSMYLSRGHAYVYFTYGSSFMLNVASEEEDTGAGVLIRALEPLAGIETMQRLRGTMRLLDLTRGPGRLAQALAIDFAQDGVDLCAPGPLWLGAMRTARPRIGTALRIGLTRNAKRVWRFYERGNPFVSGPRVLLKA